MTQVPHTHSDTQTHTHMSTSIGLWSLQSNSFRQKSFKQPRFWASRYPPPVSSLLNSHQPPLLPKITQERHSSPLLTAAQLGRKRGIKTHTKKETHHIVDGGRKSIHTAPCLKISTDDFGKRRTTHTNAPGQDRGKEKCVCGCMHTFWMRYSVTVSSIHFWSPSTQWFNH